MPKIYAYIDGFNLYRGAVKPNGMQWLDLNALCKSLAGEPIAKIIFCTALVSDTPQDRKKSVRQQLYLRILNSFPNIEVVLGQFRREKTGHEVRGCLSSPPCYIRTWKQEEKGSDVNLASRLLHNAHRNDFERALVITGDSDLVEPIRLAVSELGKKVDVINPRKAAESKELKAVASSYNGMEPKLLSDCQLPNPYPLGKKMLSKPLEWGSATKAKQSDVNHGQCTTCGIDICTRRHIVDSQGINNE